MNIYLSIYLYPFIENSSNWRQKLELCTSMLNPCFGVTRHLLNLDASLLAGFLLKKIV